MMRGDDGKLYYYDLNKAAIIENFVNILVYFRIFQTKVSMIFALNSSWQKQLNLKLSKP
jgi:hypothetical protein